MGLISAIRIDPKHFMIHLLCAIPDYEGADHTRMCVCMVHIYIDWPANKNQKHITKICVITALSEL